MIIAIDGPAGAGKSTVARRLATRLGFRTLDSGAFYRAAALAWRGGGAATSAEMLRNTRIDFQETPDGTRVLMDGSDVTDAIRTAEVSARSSILAESAEVREILVGWQRRWTEHGNFVVEGRDMGTVVFPHAEAKFYVDASLEERTRRRHAELARRGETLTLGSVRNELSERDERDRARPVAPLRPAADSVRIDTTGLDPERVVDQILEILQKRNLR